MAFNKGSYSEALTECRADLTKYTIWHKSHTEPLLRLAPVEGLKLLNVDLKALAELVELLLHCHVKAGQSNSVPTALERLRSNSKDPRWQRKITYFQAMHAALSSDEAQARRELKKLGSVKEETDVEILQLYLDLFRDELTFSQSQELIDGILALAESDVERLHYSVAKAVQYLVIGDRPKADRDLETAISAYRSSRSANSTSGYAMDRLATALELLGSLRGEPQFLDEAVDLYEKMLRRDEWTSEGRAKILRQLGDSYRRKASWSEAMDAYTRALSCQRLAILKVFLAECLLNLEGWKSAATELSSIVVSNLDKAEYADYVFVMGAVSIHSGDSKRLNEVEGMLRDLQLSIPYFKERRDALLLSVIDTGRSGSSGSVIQAARRALAGIAATATRYLLLQPNFMGLGIRVDTILDDLAKRCDDHPVSPAAKPDAQ